MKAGLALCIALLHLALWSWLQQALRPQRSGAAPTAAPALAWLDLKPLPPAPLPAPAQDPGRAKRPVAAPAATIAPTRAAPQAITLPAASGTAQASGPSVVPLEPLAAAPAPQQAAAASAPAPRPSLLESAGTRRAAAAAAAKPGMAELGRVASGQAEPVSRQEQLARSVERSAVGDCLKGEFAGAGMGILSVPFFAWAELAGHCRR